MPGQSEYEAITLERGVTHDADFEQWANKVWDYHNSTVDDQQGGTGNQDVSLKDFRKDMFWRSTTKPVRRYWRTTFIVAGLQSSGVFLSSTPTGTRSPFKA